ncbi:MAG: hypothetical protein WAU10_01780, partial [Caldilineaceae bacterium]
DVLPNKIASGNWPTTLPQKAIYLEGDRILFWTHETGLNRIFEYGRNVTGNGDVLPTEITSGNWPITLPEEAIYLGGDRILFWTHDTGLYSIFEYDRSVIGNGDVLPNEIASGNWPTNFSEEVIYLPYITR